ncbi:MAG: TetR/AcrR family transcriptional regulator [Deltaproteobacteria bacterium]|nr:TetR/AcrR family transcriptional regulator [Deltaproteobacteria bacterium]
MPPKKTITKEMIVEGAFELVRKNGISALTARNISKTLKCSTQPIYSCFSTMKMLEKEVIKRASEFVMEKYLVSKTEKVYNFKSIGLGYITMAREEKYLFDLLYVSGRVSLDFENHIFPIDTDLLLSVMKRDPYLTDLPHEDLLDLLCHMWIYTHGLTVLTSTNPSVSEDFIDKALEEMGHSVVMSKLIKKGVLNHENFCDQR